MNSLFDRPDSRFPDRTTILPVLEGISLAHSSSRATPRSGSGPSLATPPGAGPHLSPIFPPPATHRQEAAPRYAFENDDDLLGPEEFGPIVFRDGIFQIDDFSASGNAGLDPKLKRLIDSILDPKAPESLP